MGSKNKRISLSDILGDEEDINISEINIDDDGVEYKSGVVQWSVIGNAFYPTGKTEEKLPSGFYELEYDPRRDEFFLRKRNIITEEILRLPDNNFELILEDIKKFWTSQNKYNNHSFIYKRGIILYGHPGCGKTSLIQLVSENLINDHKGIIINITQPDHIYDFNKIMVPLREIEPDRKIILILEDIDNFINVDKALLTKLLQILDGSNKLDNIITIATTNYQEKLEERIANRPSRFDRRYEIGLPSKEVRKYYIEKKLSIEELKNINLNEWVKVSEGFTLDHLKELLLSVFVLGYDFKDAVNEIKSMMNGKLKANGQLGTKGNIGFNVQ